MTNWNYILKNIRSDRYVVLLIAIAAFVVVGPVVSHIQYGPSLYWAMFTLVLFASCLAVRPKKRYMVTAVVFALVNAVLWGLSQLYDHPVFNTTAFHLFSISLAIVFLSIAFGIILADVLKDGPVSINKLCGSVCAYLLIGVLFTLMFEGCIFLDHNAFQSTASEDLIGSTLRQEESSLSYFSFVTLATLGYGDIVPVSKLARTMAWSEAILGQLYLTVLVARLVGLHIALSTRDID